MLVGIGILFEEGIEKRDTEEKYTSIRVSQTAKWKYGQMNVEYKINIQRTLDEIYKIYIHLLNELFNVVELANL